jgi:hypothetical protein
VDRISVQAPAQDLGNARSPLTLSFRSEASEAMTKKPIDMPKFANEGEEADWWASRTGREFVKRKSAESLKKATAPRESHLVGQLNGTASVRIGLRLPEPDVTKVFPENGIRRK